MPRVQLVLVDVAMLFGLLIISGNDSCLFTSLTVFQNVLVTFANLNVISPLFT